VSGAKEKFKQRDLRSCSFRSNCVLARGCGQLGTEIHSRYRSGRLGAEATSGVLFSALQSGLSTHAHLAASLSSSTRAGTLIHRVVAWIRSRAACCRGRYLSKGTPACATGCFRVRTASSSHFCAGVDFVDCYFSLTAICQQILIVPVSARMGPLALAGADCQAVWKNWGPRVSDPSSLITSLFIGSLAPSAFINAQYRDVFPFYHGHASTNQGGDGRIYNLGPCPQKSGPARPSDCATSPRYQVIGGLCRSAYNWAALYRKRRSYEAPGTNKSARRSNRPD